MKSFVLRVLNARSLFLAAIVSVFAVAAVIELRRRLGPDEAWLLYIAQRILGGQHIYDGAFEPTPPMILLLNCIPLLASRALDIPISIAFKAFVLLTAAGSLLFVRATAAHVRDAADRAAINMFLLALAIAFLMLPGGDVAERENFIGMLLTPWLCVAAVQDLDVRPGRAMRIGAGVLAAVAVAIKPQFLVVPVAVQALFAIRHRSIRTFFTADVIAALACLVIYAAGIVLLEPDYLGAVVPMVMATYSAFDSPWPVLLGGARMATVWLPTVLLSLTITARGWSGAIVSVLRVAFVTSLLVYFAEHKLLFYHLLPTLAFGVGLTAVFLTTLLVTPMKRSFVGFASAACSCVAIIYAVFVVVPPLAQRSYWDLVLTQPGGRPVDAFITQWVDKLPPGATLVSLSMRMNDGFPTVTERHLNWGIRYPFLLPLAQIANTREFDDELSPRLQWAEEKFRADIVHDLAASRPAVVFVDRSTWKWGFADGNFDILQFFNRDPAFQDVWKSYHFIESFHGPNSAIDVYGLSG